MKFQTAFATLLAALTLVDASANPSGDRPHHGIKRPNIIYILSDDHDHTTATSEYMPETYKHLVSHGRRYSHFYTPMSVCCPSRAGFFRSQHGHNHGILDVQGPLGGFDVFWNRGYQDDNLGVWLRQAGYKTYYTGKLMNGNTVANAQSKPTTKLFDQSAILLDPYTYTYLNSSLSWNGQAPESYPGNYSTDLIRDVGLQYLDEAAQSEEPFFLGIAPIGPHSVVEPSSPGFTNALPAARHKGLYNGTIIPRTANFNPDVPSGANFVRNYEKLNETVLDYVDEWHRDRLRALRSVDDLVGAVIERVRKLNLLDDTYIVYTSDNGFSTGGQHRRPPGKCLGYEEDIRVPAFIRGPGIQAGSWNNEAWSNIDLSASFAEVADATRHASYALDGRVMDWVRPHERGDKEQRELIDEQLPSREAHSERLNKTSLPSSATTHHLSEYWVKNYVEGIYAGNQSTSKYKTLRVRESGGKGAAGRHDWTYTVWCNGERELYDMAKDEYQMNNLLGTSNNFVPLNGTAHKSHRIATRLDALLLSLKRCVGQECRQTWETLFPKGQVASLEQALHKRYDDYFQQLPRVHYDDCEIGFDAAKEQSDWSEELQWGA